MSGGRIKKDHQLGDGLAKRRHTFELPEDFLRIVGNPSLQQGSYSPTEKKLYSIENRLSRSMT
jgi:hypothetical protein